MTHPVEPMIYPQPDPSPTVALEWSARVLFVLGPVLGVLVTVARLASGITPSLEPRVLDAIVPALGFGLAGWVAGTGFQGLAKLIRVMNAQAQAADRVERRLADELPQLIRALDSARSASPQGPVADPIAARVGEIRQAIEQERWSDAQTLVNRFSADLVDHPEPARLKAELSEAQDLARQELLSRIEAAREVNDPDRVIELRESLGPLLEGEARSELDKGLGKWFLLLIHRRLRTGTVRSDVAILAGRVAEVLGQTTEGASLRASLPMLRRAGGLCPRCAQPYTGLGDACPACLGGSSEPNLYATGDGDVGTDDDLEMSPPVDEFGIGQLGN